MIALKPLGTGVSCKVEDGDAEFLYGSIEGLAIGIRNTLWEHLELFRDTELIIVRVGGERAESLEPVLEVESSQPGLPYETLVLTREQFAALHDVRRSNLPTSHHARWNSGTDVERGRIELYVYRPSFHELAESQMPFRSGTAA